MLSWLSVTCSASWISSAPPGQKGRSLVLPQLMCHALCKPTRNLPLSEYGYEGGTDGEGVDRKEEQTGAEEGKKTGWYIK